MSHNLYLPHPVRSGNGWNLTASAQIQNRLCIIGGRGQQFLAIHLSPQSAMARNRLDDFPRRKAESKAGLYSNMTSPWFPGFEVLSHTTWRWYIFILSNGWFPMTTRWFTDGKGQVPRYIWTRQVPLGYSDDGQGSHPLNPHFPGEKSGEHHISVGSRQTWKPPISMRLFVIIAVVIIFWGMGLSPFQNLFLVRGLSLLPWLRRSPSIALPSGTLWVPAEVGDGEGWSGWDGVEKTLGLSENTFWLCLLRHLGLSEKLISNQYDTLW